MLWHRRLSHCSAMYLREIMRKSKVLLQIKFSDDVFRKCKVCAEAKAKRSSHKSKRTPPKRKFEVISSYILDPECVAYDGKKLTVTFTDVFSGHVRFNPINKKSEVPTMFARFHKKVSNRFPDCPIAELQCDNAPEYTKGEMELYCNQTGIDIESGCPYVPEFDGTSERKGLDIIEKMRTLLIDAGMAPNMWPYAIKVIEYLMNRIPTETNESFLLLSDIRRAMDREKSLEEDLKIANAKSNSRPNIDLTEQHIVPPWILNNNNLTLEM